MGTILMKVDLNHPAMNDATVEKLKQYCFEHLTSREINYFATNDSLREKLVQCDLSQSLQHGIHCARELSRDECISILENSSKVWSEIITEYQYDLELLYKVADKINLSYVDGQDSLDSAFVVKYADSMDMSDFVSRRTRNGTIEQFFDVPQVLERYIRNSVTWRMSRNDLIDFIARFKTDVNRTEIEQFVNDLYNKPVNEVTLTAAYSDRTRASHSIDTVVSYFKNNRTQTEYATWDEYATDCANTGNCGLADVWFRDYYRPEIVAFAGVKN